MTNLYKRVAALRKPRMLNADVDEAEVPAGMEFGVAILAREFRKLSQICAGH